MAAVKISATNSKKLNFKKIWFFFQEERVLNETRTKLQQQKWHLLQENDKIKEKIRVRDAAAGAGTGTGAPPE